jgi:hypothetical protein
MPLYIICPCTYCQKPLLAELIKSEGLSFDKGEEPKRNIILLNGQKYANIRKKGLGIKDIRKLNISLLCKWWWRPDKEEGLWQKSVKFKYLKNNSIHSVKHKQYDSAVWADLLKIKDIYLQGRKILVKNGKNTSFWKDSWLYEKPLCILYPDLFKFYEQPNVSIFQVHSNIESVSFTRWLTGNLLLDWNKIVDDMNNINFITDNDVVLWRFGPQGRFSVRSVYNAMIRNESGPYHKKIWKSKNPAKIKIFLWLMMNNAILTKDNLLKRKWSGDPSCYFCDNDENICNTLGVKHALSISNNEHEHQLAFIFT